MSILGIDPGPTESAYCLIDDSYQIVAADKIKNENLLNVMDAMQLVHVAIESIQSYGMPVGREVFDTCYMIGRIIQRCDDTCVPYTLIPRPEYTRRICGVGKVTDAILRQALLLRFGGDKKGEPLFQLKGASDKRSAFAVAAYHLDKHPRRGD